MNKPTLVIVNILIIIVAIVLGLFSLVPIIFCDSGPASACLFSGGFIAIGPLIGIILTGLSFVFIAKDKDKSSMFTALAIIFTLAPIALSRFFH